jgi:lysyl-tRNA synthetase class 2
MNLSREEQDRLERLNKMIDLGINPYPDDPAHKTYISRALDSFNSDSQSEAYTIAGRAMMIRDLGSIAFIKVSDDSGEMQVILNKKSLPNYKEFNSLVDVGDIIEATGVNIVSKTGEKSVAASGIRILSKALKPLPDKYKGLEDTEVRYRRRELDLIVNPDVKNKFKLRSKMISNMRNYLELFEFMEVETPIFHPIPGGANARPFETHHNALNSNFYLRIAPELYLKRLIVGGFEKIFEIGRCFRNEGIDRSHNPEFTMLELYWSYVDRDRFTIFLENLIGDTVLNTFDSYKIAKSDGTELDFTTNDLRSSFPQKTFRQAIIDASEIDIDLLLTEDDIKSISGIDFSGCVGRGECLDQLWKFTARPTLNGPIWITDYPIELKPLAKKSPTDATKSSSMQLIIGGEEIVNAYYHELNNPIEQEKRFTDQQALRDSGSEDAQSIDHAFLDALKQGMPPTAGVGIGIDRLISLLTDSPNLKEVILFPTLKRG